MKFFLHKYMFFLNLILGLMNIGIWVDAGGIFALITACFSALVAFGDIYLMVRMNQSSTALIAAICYATEKFPGMTGNKLLNYLALRYPLVLQKRFIAGIVTAHELNIIADKK